MSVLNILLEEVYLLILGGVFFLFRCMGDEDSSCSDGQEKESVTGEESVALQTAKGVGVGLKGREHTPYRDRDD